jgi:acyl-coenzyme A synthetase/AMP-(fatty) acid ligase
MFGTSEIAYAALVKISTKYRKNYARDIGNSNMSIADAKLIDENGLDIEKDLVPGKIVTKSPTMFKRYENDQDKTREAFFDGWFWPGDVCYKKNCNFIHLDRYIDTLTYNNKKYYSLLIEEVMFQTEGVMEVSVFNYHSDIVAVIETGVGYNEENMRKILEKNDLAFIKVKVAAGNVLPRGVTNKILKRELRETGGSMV